MWDLWERYRNGSIDIVILILAKRIVIDSLHLPLIRGKLNILSIKDKSDPDPSRGSAPRLAHHGGGEPP